MILRSFLLINLILGAGYLAYPSKTVARPQAYTQLGSFEARLISSRVLLLTIKGQQVSIVLGQPFRAERLRLKASAMPQQGLASSRLRTTEGEAIHLAIFTHARQQVIRVKPAHEKARFLTLRQIQGDMYQIQQASSLQTQQLEQAYLSYQQQLDQTLSELKQELGALEIDLSNDLGVL